MLPDEGLRHDASGRPSWAVSAALWRAMDNPRREETWERMTREERLVLLNDLHILPSFAQAAGRFAQAAAASR